MTERVYTGLIPAAKMEQVVAHCHFTPQALFLAEQLPRYMVKNRRDQLNLLQFIHFKSDLASTEYSSGRIFQQDRELRWEREGEKIRVVYVGPVEENEAQLRDDRLRPGTVELSTLEKTLAYYYLFGERLRKEHLEKMGKAAQKGDFAVVRIPRILRYPVENDEKRYALLAVCEYRVPETGQLALFRFQGVEAWSDEK